MTVMPFRIRVATAQDMDQLCELAGKLVENIRAEATMDDVRRVLEHIMNSADSKIVAVAESGATLCGYTYASFEWRAEFRGETMDVLALFVSPQWRNKGVGHALLACLLENARQRGVRRITAEVHPGNSAIEHTLESSG